MDHTEKSVDPGHICLEYLDNATQLHKCTLQRGEGGNPESCRKNGIKIKRSEATHGDSILLEITDICFLRHHGSSIRNTKKIGVNLP